MSYDIDIGCGRIVINGPPIPGWLWEIVAPEFDGILSGVMIRKDGINLGGEINGKYCEKEISLERFAELGGFTAMKRHGVVRPHDA